MTTRELTITKAVLDFLHSLEGGQATEIEIHAAINQAPQIRSGPLPSAAELEAVIRNLDADKFITGVAARFNRRVMKWNINDAGEAARLELR